MTTDTTTAKSEQRPPEVLEVNLRDPLVAAFLAWLIPGAGHLYQGRIAKAILFFVCIMGTFSFGMYLGGGHVVYASLRSEDRRLPYFCQVGVGLPALPALVQAQRMRGQMPEAPLWNSPEGAFMAPPRLPGQIVPRGSIPEQDVIRAISPEYVENKRDELADWNLKYHSFFELGTVYTMIAGLLNVLAIYDAFAGPLLILPDNERREGDDDRRREPST